MFPSMQSASSRKDSSILQLNSRISQGEKDLKRAQDKFQEEKTLLTNREADLLKAKADVRPITLLHAFVFISVFGFEIQTLRLYSCT